MSIINYTNWICDGIEPLQVGRKTRNSGIATQRTSPKQIAVTHVSKWFPPDIGGLEQHVYYVTSNLARLGIDCRVLALKSRERVEFPTYLTAGLSVKRVGQYVIGPPTFSKLLKHYKCFIQWSLEMTRSHKNSEILHIHAPSLTFRMSPWHNVNPQLLLKKMNLLRKPTVVTFHGLRSHYETRSVHLDQMDVESGNAFIGVDKSICHGLQNHFRLPTDKVFYIPNGVDTELFFPSKSDLALKKRLFKNPSSRVILLPRRADPKNGILQAIEALSKIIRDHRDVRMLILGFGSHPLFTGFEGQVLSKIRKLGLENYVLTHQAVPHRLMRKYYNISYLSLVPSLWEATSLSALESLACGVPVIASNTGGLPEVVTNEVGMLNEPGNVDEIVKDTSYLLDNPHIRESMSKKAIAISKKRDWKAIAEKILVVYERILGLN